MTRSRTILIVDDDAKIVLALEKRLEHAGYRALGALDAQAALAHLRHETVDAITLDVKLPGELDGLTLAAQLRCDPLTARIPVIFVTGSADAEFKSKSQAVGGKYFLAKPYDPDLLLAALRNIFAVDELAQVRQIASAKRRQPV